MQRASRLRRRALGVVGLAAVALLWAAPATCSLGFVTPRHVSQAHRAQVRADHAKAVTGLAAPAWLPFADVLNSWLQGLQMSPATSVSVTLSEYEAMNDELASMQARLLAAQDRERRAHAAMEELELEMEKDRLEIAEKMEMLSRRTAPGDL